MAAFTPEVDTLLAKNFCFGQDHLATNDNMPCKVQSGRVSGVSNAVIISAYMEAFLTHHALTINSEVVALGRPSIHANVRYKLWCESIDALWKICPYSLHEPWIKIP